jgi:uncharacterized protein with ACT and thioredoxin-like domain
MILKEILKRINPVEVVKTLRRSNKKVATRGIIMMGGSGSLIGTGVTLVADGASNESWYEICGGAFLVLIGVFIGDALSEKVKELNKENDGTE